jgi:hypothetical protein
MSRPAKSNGPKEAMRSSPKSPSRHLPDLSSEQRAVGELLNGLDLIEEIWGSNLSCSTVNVDMVAADADIRPPKPQIFLRDVSSCFHSEQTKGRGEHIVARSELRSISGEDARSKSRFASLPLNVSALA